MSKQDTTRREFIAATAGAAAVVSTFGFNRMAQAAHHEGAAPITQIVKFTVKEGQLEGATALLQEMTAAVEKDEPGVLAYVAHTSKTNPNTVVFFEVYKDEEAVKAHNTTPHMGKMRQNFMNFFTPPLDIEGLDKVSGFMR